MQGGNFQNTKIDGMTMFITVPSAMEQFQQIEVVNGVPASLYGPANPSGMFNFVSKRPTDEPLREVGVAYNSDSIGTVRADLGGKLGRAVFRLPPERTLRSGDGYVDRSHQRRVLGDLGIDIALGPGVLELNYSDYALKNKGYPGWFTYGQGSSCPWPGPHPFGYGQAYAGVDMRNRATVRLKQELGSNWHLIAGILHQDAAQHQYAGQQPDLEHGRLHLFVRQWFCATLRHHQRYGLSQRRLLHRSDRP